MEKMYCAVCGREIKPGTSVAMELSNKDGLYYANGIPSDHKSQGWFDLGSGCARIEERKHSNPDIPASFDPF